MTKMIHGNNSLLVVYPGHRISLSVRGLDVLLLIVLATLTFSIGPSTHAQAAPQSPKAPTTSNTYPSTGSGDPSHTSSENCGRVVVSFSRGDANHEAPLLGEEYGATLISVDEASNFAIFKPGNPDDFVKAVSQDPMVRYSERDTPFCALDSVCGSPELNSKTVSVGQPISQDTAPKTPSQSGSPDFTLTGTPSSENAAIGSVATSTITVSSLNGYSGMVSFADRVNPHLSNSPYSQVDSISNDQVSLTSGGSVNVTYSLRLSPDEAPGVYIVTITGTDYSIPLSHSVTLSFTEGDFVLSAAPSSRTIPLGSSAIFNLTVTSVFNFAGEVNLKAVVSPAVTGGPTSSLSLRTASVGSAGTATSILNVTTTSSTPALGYTILVTGSSGASLNSVCVGINLSFPNDVCYGNQWGPQDLNLPTAWQNTVGTKAVIVALIDTGVTISNPDLSPNLWTAPDGSHGWNCVAGNNNVTDDFGHGTATGATVAAVINNGVAVSGTAQEQLMEIKAADANGNFYASSVACGIRWATDHGANIISMSLGILQIGRAHV